jgi:hypothetical protein
VTTNLRIEGAILVGLAFGCGSAVPTASPGSHRDAGAVFKDAGGEASTSSYGGSACATCVARACSSEVTACAGDPDCATYLACLEACPVGPGGGVSAVCERACPAGSSSSGQSAEQVLLACMATGPGSQCPACGGEQDAGDLASVVLHQQCPPSAGSLGGCGDCLRAHCCQVIESCQTPQCLGYESCVLACATPSDDGGTVDDGPQDDGANDGANDEALDGGSVDDGSDEAAAFANVEGACEEACELQYPDGRPGWAPLNACVQVFCGAPNACADMASPCLQCITAKCPSEYVDYIGSSDGFALAFCVDGCAPTALACTTACYNQYPGGLMTASAVNQCALELCPACQPP